jgi:hypothetical protein
MNQGLTFLGPPDEGEGAVTSSPNGKAASGAVSGVQSISTAGTGTLRPLSSSAPRDEKR